MMLHRSYVHIAGSARAFRDPHEVFTHCNLARQPLLPFQHALKARPFTLLSNGTLQLIFLKHGVRPSFCSSGEAPAGKARSELGNGIAAINYFHIDNF